MVQDSDPVFDACECVVVILCGDGSVGCQFDGSAVPAIVGAAAVEAAERRLRFKLIQIDSVASEFVQHEVNFGEHFPGPVVISGGAYDQVDVRFRRIVGIDNEAVVCGEHHGVGIFSGGGVLQKNPGLLRRQNRAVASRQAAGFRKFVPVFDFALVECDQVGFHSGQDFDAGAFFTQLCQAFCHDFFVFRNGNMSTPAVFEPRSRNDDGAVQRVWYDAVLEYKGAFYRPVQFFVATDQIDEVEIMTG